MKFLNQARAIAYRTVLDQSLGGNRFVEDQNVRVNIHRLIGLRTKRTKPTRTIVPPDIKVKQVEAALLHQGNHISVQRQNNTAAGDSIVRYKDGAIPIGLQHACHLIKRNPKRIEKCIIIPNRAEIVS